MAPSQTARDAVKRRFYNEGITVTDWARANDFDVNLVYGVLSGRSRAQRGESHRIAIALGLKQNEEAGGLEQLINPTTGGKMS
ncbi:DNA-binding protein [Massilia sp. CCM 8695]|uniref:DNA-binding protein n=1 Tax=Massilia frigida TaxID=2609281 RepID=A0ABX0NIZ2_9BURK|nr:DNA-binding protein [Massilia frigida]NHZ83614.1 DNA-binding protein [Massilia frigida]